MFNQMTLLKNKIQDVERETRSKQLKSINDLYQEKNLFVQFYRCLKMAEVCCRGDNKKRIIDENIRDWILKIAEKVVCFLPVLPISFLAPRNPRTVISVKIFYWS